MTRYRKNKYCRYAEVNNGLVIFNTKNNSAIEVDLITKELWFYFNNKILSKYDILSFYKKYDNEVDISMVDDAIEILMSEGVIYEC